MYSPFGGEEWWDLGAAQNQQDPALCGTSPQTEPVSHRQVITEEKGKGEKERERLPTEMEVKESGGKTLQRFHLPCQSIAGQRQ